MTEEPKAPALSEVMAELDTLRGRETCRRRKMTEEEFQIVHAARTSNTDNPGNIVQWKVFIEWWHKRGGFGSMGWVKKEYMTQLRERGLA